MLQVGIGTASILIAFVSSKFYFWGGMLSIPSRPRPPPNRALFSGNIEGVEMKIMIIRCFAKCFFSEQ